MAKFGRNSAGPVRTQQGPGALERVKALESFRDEILRAVRSTFAAVEQRLQNLEEINEALVSVVGRTQIEEEVKRLHIERVEAKADIEAKALEAAIKAGKLKEAEVIGDMSIVCGSEVDKDGNQLYPTRVQLVFVSLKPEYQDKLRGAKKGDVAETPFGSKFTVAAVYDVVPEAQQATPAVVPSFSSPLVEGQPLDEEAETKVLEELSAAAEQIDAESAAVENQLVEDLASNS